MSKDFSYFFFPTLTIRPQVSFLFSNEWQKGKSNSIDEWMNRRSLRWNFYLWEKKNHKKQTDFPLQFFVDRRGGEEKKRREEKFGVSLRTILISAVLDEQEIKNENNIDLFLPFFLSSLFSLFLSFFFLFFFSFSMTILLESTFALALREPTRRKKSSIIVVKTTSLLLVREKILKKEKVRIDEIGRNLCKLLLKKATHAFCHSSDACSVDFRTETVSTSQVDTELDLLVLSINRSSCRRKFEALQIVTLMRIMKLKINKDNVHPHRLFVFTLISLENRFVW